MKPTVRCLAVTAAGLALTGVAQAQSKTWILNDTSSALPSTAVCTQTAAGNGSAIGNAYGCQEQPTGKTNTLQITGWSGTSSANFAKAAVTPQSGNGYGVGNVAEGGKSANGWTGDHSVDNGGVGGTDALLLRFTSGAEALTQVTVGWTGSDGDFSILRWVGAAAPTEAQLMTNLQTDAMTGWELVSTVGGSGGVNTPDWVVSGFNKSNLTSSYWLLSAYDAGYGTSTSGTKIGTVTTGVDQLKFLAVGTTSPLVPPQSVPEPVSLALVGVALVGAAAARRTSKAAKA